MTRAPRTVRGRGALIVLPVLAGLRLPAAHAEATDPSAAARPAALEPSTLAKKDRERARKAPATGPAPRTGRRPGRLLNLYNSWTHEWLAFDPKAPPAPSTVDRFLRDHYTNRPTAMEPRLLGIVASAATHFDSDTAIVVSAFRHPKYNLMLRKKGHQVARDSSHTKGNAIDFYLPRTPTPVLHAWAKDQRLGGVGLYLESGFVHMDTGAIRYWDGE